MSWTDRVQPLWRNYGALAALRAVNVLLPLALYPVLLHRLGPDLFGLVIFAQAIATYFMMGANYATEIYGTRLISRSKHDPALLRREASQLWWMKLLLLAVVAAVYAGMLALWPFTHDHLFVFAFSLHVVVYEAFFPVWFFQGVEDVAPSATLNIAAKLLGALLLLTWVVLPKDAWLVPSAYMASALAMAVVATFMLYRRLGGIQAPRPREIARHLREGWPFFVTNLSGMLYVNANRVLIGAIGMAEVAYYDLAEKVVQLAKAPQQILGLSLFPRLSSAQEPRSVVQRFAPYSLAVNSALTLAVFAAAPWIVPLLSPGLPAEGELMTEAVLQVLSLNIVVVGLNSIVVIQRALAQDGEHAVMRFSLESLGFYLLTVSALYLGGRYEVIWLSGAAVLVECYLLARTYLYLRRGQ
jgi:O-antigen/teichoic acid export membrane protein